VTRAYLSLGSNLGDRRRNLAEGVRRLATPEVIVRRLSSVYETEPQDLPEQPWFLNLVVEIDTTLDVQRLLEHLQAIEAALERRRQVPKGPRTLDIDILLYGETLLDSPELTLPHPRMAARRFVLEPLAELAPQLRHPALGRTVRELLEKISGQPARNVGPLG
jgi:2-amino-4-hydroxy-6-hydroxymethyldihydropteridine diphosphokinase